MYRIRHSASKLTDWRNQARGKPLNRRTLDELFADLGSSVPAWRTGAQNELLRRGNGSVVFLKKQLDGKLTKAQQTWSLWTLGRLSTDALLDVFERHKSSVNVHLQTLRIIAAENPSKLRELLAWESDNARLRHATVQAVWQSNQRDLSHRLIELVADERDRVVFYAAWNAVRDLMLVDSRRELINDSQPRVRLAALLGLFLDNELDAEEVLPLRSDADPQVARLVEMWLEKTGSGSPLVTLSPPPGQYAGPVSVKAKSSLPGSFLTYTVDGSTPAMTGRRVTGPITIERDTTLRFAVFQQNTQAGAITKASYRIRPTEAYRQQEFVRDLVTDSGLAYELDWTGLAAGKRHYTDRDYRITEIPAELDRLPYLRTANQDDRRLTDRLVSLRSDTDVTVYVAVDARIARPLTWMNIGQQGGFRDTGLEIVTTDPTFRVYKKRYPAGAIRLGANLNHKNDSRRGNYIVAFKRNFLTREPNEKPVSVQKVLAAMPGAEASRGRELFLNPHGAGCFKCHRMQGVGQVLGPDLSDIGNRAKTPEVLIESIIHPSRVITEGFAQQQILTVDGRVLSGSVLRETGRAVTLASSDASVTTIAKDKIEERVGSKVSPMPSGFAESMTAQQIADLTAWLMKQKVPGDRKGFWFRVSRDSLEISLGDQRIASYLKDHPKLTRRALVNVMTPGGIQVTRNFPPRKPEDLDPGYQAEQGIIHPIMHPGIWISYGDVDGNDYWRLKARVKFDGFVVPPKGDRTTGSFGVRNRFLSEDGSRVVCDEITRYEFHRVDEGWLLKIDAEYRSSDADFYFGDQEESGLAVRVASPIRVQGGTGTILNNRGERNGAEVWGKRAKWFDYFGVIDGRRVGIMVAPSPNNPRPSWLHARDYGVVVTNPFPKQPRERREPYVKTAVKRGQPYRLAYAILIHDAPVKARFDRNAVAETLMQSFDDTHESPSR